MTRTMQALHEAHARRIGRQRVPRGTLAVRVGDVAIYRTPETQAALETALRAARSGRASS